MITCSHCGVAFRRRNTASRYCGLVCARAAHGRSPGLPKFAVRADWPIGRTDIGHRRRARRYGVPYEKFRPREIYERDGWVCQICITPVDRTVMFPDRLSASLDHIVPLSMGGEHTRENSRLAHLGCNCARRIDADSLFARLGPKSARLMELAMRRVLHAQPRSAVNA